MTHTHTTHDTHTGGWLLARHRSTPRAIARRRSPPRSPVAAARRRSARDPPFSHRSRARRATSPTRRAPSVRHGIHPSIRPVPHREKAPCRGPPRRSRIDFFARSDGTDGRIPADGRTRRDEIERDEIERDERNRTNERRSARGNRARADAIPRFPSRPPSFARSLVRSFASSRGANQNHKPIVFEWIMGFGTTKTPGKNQSSSLCR